MTARPVFDGRRQRAALTRFQDSATERGKSVTAVASALGLSDGQYRRYLWGKVPLRTDQIAPFATAYGISTRELTEALGLIEPADAPAATWDFLDALREIGPDWWAEGVFRENVAAPLNAQRQFVEFIARELASGRFTIPPAPAADQPDVRRTG